MAEAFKQSDIEILVATMNRATLDFLEPMFPFSHFSNFNILVVNQTEPGVTLASPYPSVRVLNSHDKGLAKSRNLALQNAMGALGVITDGDVIFDPNFEANILKAFSACPDAGVISFRVQKSHGVLYKKYPGQRVEAKSWLQLLNIMSVEMVINTKAIKKHSITFNEHFGLGATFGMGEEALFLKGIKRNNLKVMVEPAILVAHPGNDTHAKIDIIEKYYTTGAVFTALFGEKFYLWVFLKLFFELKQQNIKIKQVRAAVKAAIKGNCDYKKLHEYNTK